MQLSVCIKEILRNVRCKLAIAIKKFRIVRKSQLHFFFFIQWRKLASLSTLVFLRDLFKAFLNNLHQPICFYLLYIYLLCLSL